MSPSVSWAALVLLIGAGLLFASFRRVLAVDPGFDPHAVLTASISLPQTRYASDDAIRRFTRDALQGIRAIPGVVSAGATTLIPFGDDFSQDIMLPEGYRMTPGDSLVAMYYSVVTPGYFEAMRVPLISGRFFDDRDTFNAAKAVIVDERLAKRYWPGIDPVGRRMYEPTDPKDITAVTNRTEWYTVIGVVKEVRLKGFVEGVGETGAYYTAVTQTPGRGRALTFAARTSVTPTSIASAVRDQIARVDPDLPVFDVQTMTERASGSLATRRSPMMLSIAFGVVALFLSAIGLYGVLAYLVTQRTKEIGVRMALGSTKAAVLYLVLREGLILLAGGLVLGAVGAVALSRTLESQLFRVRATDPLVLSVAVATLILIAVGACALPAHRATKIDPVIALSE